jgi:hypothetical protein
MMNSESPQNCFSNRMKIWRQLAPATSHLLVCRHGKGEDGLLLPVGQAGDPVHVLVLEHADAKRRDDVRRGKRALVRVHDDFGGAALVLALVLALSLAVSLRISAVPERRVVDGAHSRAKAEALVVQLLPKHLPCLLHKDVLVPAAISPA